MKVDRWMWKAAEKLVFAGLVLFILVPFSWEAAFVRDLYRNQPILCVGLLTAVAAFVIATAVHFTQERQKRSWRTVSRFRTGEHFRILKEGELC